MKFYKIENPTTKQIFDAIINNDYVPLEKLAPKAKQIRVLLLDHWCADEEIELLGCYLRTYDDIFNL